MNCKICDKIIEKADKCPNNFSCLKDDEFKLCPVVDYIENGDVLFVNAKYYVVCPYMLPFADSNICHCPVRIKIYKECKK